MKLKIVKVPDKLLKQKSVEIKTVDNKIKNLIDDMIETMYADNGIGLSAVQIGQLLKLVVVDIKDKEDKNPLVFINPKIIKSSKEKKLMEEGCLSVPGQRAEVLRNLSVEIEYNDIDMSKKTLKADGLLAHCLQHEIDHTNGIVYLDYLSKLKRDTLIKKSQKYDKLNNKN